MFGRNRHHLALQSLALLLPMLVSVAGAVPAQLSYQGMLSDPAGTPRTGSFPMGFAIHADSLGGAPLWSEAYAAVAVEGGVFSVMLGSQTPVPSELFAGGVLWLETTVNDTTLAPRRPIVASAYAFRAAVADSAERSPLGNSVESAEITDGTVTNTDIAAGATIAGVKIAPDFGAQEVRTTGDLRGATVRVTRFEMTTGAQAGHVLTTDLSGIASWQPAPVTGVGGGGLAGRIPLFASGSTLTNSSILESAGSIGLGTAGPLGRIHVQGLSPSAPVAILQAASGQTANLQEWGGSGGLLASVGSDGRLSIGTNTLVAEPATGRVGIGTTSPTQALDVSGVARVSGLQMTPGAFPGYVLTSPDFSGNAMWQPASGGELGDSIDSFEIVDGTIVNADISGGAAIAGSKVSPNFGSQNMVTLGRLGLGTTTPTKLLTLEASIVDYDITTTGSGNFDITSGAGTGAAISISAQENSSAGITIAPNNNVGIAAPNPGNILTIQQNSLTDPVADSWGTYSSRRWKENIVPIEGALDVVGRLRGVTFDWKATKRHDLGMIAEEVGAVVPELSAVTDPTGAVVQYTYDGSNRLTSIIEQDGDALTIAYYPGLPVVREVTMGQSRRTFSFDGATRTTRVYDLFDPLTVGESAYTFDANGRCTKSFRLNRRNGGQAT